MKRLILLSLLLINIGYTQTDTISPSTVNSGILIYENEENGESFTCTIGQLSSQTLIALDQSMEIGFVHCDFCGKTATYVEKSLLSTPIQVYPNPVRHSLQLRYEDERQLHYRLININGQLILKGKFRQSAILSIDGLTKGLYTLLFSDDEGQFVQETRVQVE